MFQLSVQDIHPGQQASNKEEAIRQIAGALVQAGNVADGYVNGMLAREQQTSTFLGNGIAIPHGTTDTRDQVLKPACRFTSSRRAYSGAKARWPMSPSVSRQAPMSTWACCVS